MLCISVFVFFESVQENFYPGHFWLTGRQIHFSRIYVFYFFVYLTLLMSHYWVPAVIRFSRVFYLFLQKNCSRVLNLANPDFFRADF